MSPLPLSRMSFISPLPRPPLSAPRAPPPPLRRAPTARAPSATRRSFLSTAASAALLPLLPRRAAAAPLTRTEALVEARAARAALGALALLVSERRFEEFRRALRGGAVGQIRASCNALVEDGAAQAAPYKKVIAGVEAVDGMALKASRGDGKAADKVLGVYDGLVEVFDQFLEGVAAAD